MLSSSDNNEGLACKASEEKKQGLYLAFCDQSVVSGQLELRNWL